MKTLVTVLFIFYTGVCIGEKLKTKTLDVPHSESLEDLSFLKEELKDVQVLMLGEISHAHANVFQMKTRIIKYLHKEMGFTTIAFESGIYDMWKVNNSFLNENDTRKVLQNSLHGVWGYAKEFQPLIEYISKMKIKVFGFDNQLTGSDVSSLFVSDLYQYCNKYKFSFDLNRADFELLIESLVHSQVFDEEDISYSKFEKTITKLLEQIERQPDTDQHFYWKQILKT